MMSIKLTPVIPREKGARLCMDERVLQNNTMHRKRGKHVEKEAFSAGESLKRGPLSRLFPYHSSQMRMSAAAMI